MLSRLDKRIFNLSAPPQPRPTGQADRRWETDMTSAKPAKHAPMKKEDASSPSPAAPVEPAAPKAAAKAKEMSAKTKAVLKFVTSTEGHHSVSTVRKGVALVKWDRETRDALRRLTAAGLIQTGKDAGVEVFFSK